MSRAKDQDRPAAPAGELAAMTIGFEHLLLPAAVAFKLLPLLAKAISVDSAFDRQTGELYVNGRRLKVECKLVQRGAVQLDKHRDMNGEPS